MAEVRLRKTAAGNAKKNWRRKTAGAVVPPPFFIQIFITDPSKKILFQYLQKHRRSTEFKIYLDIREFEKNDEVPPQGCL